MYYYFTNIFLIFYTGNTTYNADSGSLGLHLLDCWVHVFESRWWDEGSSLIFVVCCVGNGLCDGMISGSEEYVYMYICVKSKYFKSEAI